MHISKDAFEAQQPEPGAHSHSGLSPRGLATGRWLVSSRCEEGWGSWPREVVCWVDSEEDN